MRYPFFHRAATVHIESENSAASAEPQPTASRPVADVRKALDEASKHVAGFFAVFLLVTTYLFITVASTSHEMLLKESELPLPIIGVAIPLIGFYRYVPQVYVLLHLNLLYHLYMLHRQVRLFEGAIRYSEQRSEERALVFPFVLNRWLMDWGRKSLVRLLASLISVTTLYGAPIALLLYFQAQFLPYHSLHVTWWERVAVVLDLFLFAAFSIAIRGRLSCARALIKVVGLVGVLFVSFVVLCQRGEPFDWIKEPVAGPPLDNERAKISKVFPRDLFLSGRLLVEAPPSQEVLAAYIREGLKTEDAWKDHVQALNLSGRDLRFATFISCRFYKVDLSEAALQGANLTQAQLQGANLTDAQLRSADLTFAQLQGAQLWGADFTLAQLRGAKLAGVDLRGSLLTEVDPPDFNHANWREAYFILEDGSLDERNFVWFLERYGTDEEKRQWVARAKSARTPPRK